MGQRARSSSGGRWGIEGLPGHGCEAGSADEDAHVAARPAESDPCPFTEGYQHDRRASLPASGQLAIAGLLACALTLFAGPSFAADSIAVAFGEPLAAEDLAGEADEAARVARLRDWIWQRVRAHFIAREQIAATPDEVAELAAYDREFERRDRAQRARKLAELEARLSRRGLAADEREWLEEFRRVLARMAERDAEMERKPPEEAAPAVDYSGWVEFWKVNQLLYARYGGTVVGTGVGPVPSGAWQALIEDYERAGMVTVFDASLRRRLHELLARPPAPVLPPERVDFTPFWKRPIPSSYFAD